MKLRLLSILCVLAIGVKAQIPNLIASYNFNANNGTDAGPGVKANAIKNAYDFDFDRFNNKGMSARLNGVNEFFNCGSPAKCLFTTGFTISAWIKLGTISGQQAIVSKWSGSQSQDQYLFMVSNGKLVLAVGNPSFSASGYTANTTLSAGTWYHVVAQWDNSGLHEIFLNGVSDLSVTNASFNNINSTSPTPLYIGSQMGASRFLNGFIDEVKMYDRKLSSTEINQLYNEPNIIVNNLVSKYPFNGDAKDVVSSNDADFSGASYTADRFGNANSAANVVVNTGLMNFYDSYDGFSTPTSQGTVSYSFWINFNSLNNAYQMILAKSADGGCAGVDRQFLFRINSNNKLELTTYGTLTLGNNHAFEATNTVFTTGTWYHVVLTYDNSVTTNSGLDKYQIYVNGSQQGKTPSPANGIGAGTGFLNGNACIGVGGYLQPDSTLCANAQRLDAKFDDFEIYNKTLSAAEVGTLYTNQLTGISNFTVDNIELTVFPNPATSEIFIKASKPMNLDVYNASGNQVFNCKVDSETKIDLNGWAPGIYLIRDNTSGKFTRFVVQ